MKGVRVMTNAQIIFNESMELMKAGIIGTTGRVFVYEDQNGEKHEVQEPEPLHTFAKWKEYGYSVKKGEHAKAAFYIWKAGKGKAAKEEDPNADGNEELKMFMKKAFFFTFDQVEKIKEREVKTA
jgi:hypothetical protein